MSIDYTSYSNNDTTEPNHVNELNYYGQTPEVEVETEIESDSSDEKSEDIMLKVDNCEKCYIRENADKNSPHIAVVSNDDDLLVIGASEIDDNKVLWHNVCTESGAEGYIMSKFTNYKE